MTFGEKLKNARVDAGFTQSGLAKLLNTTNTTVSNWENNVSKPDLDMLSYICGSLDVSASYFLQSQLPEDEVSLPELKLIKKYRSLDPYGQETVNYILDREAARTAALNEKDVLIAQLQIKPANTRIIQYYQRLASAGTGEVIFEDMPIDRIEIPDVPKYKRVSYAIGVNGHSMEPLYYDGDMLLIEPTCQVDIGEIGIFIVGDKAYVKKLGNGELISLNAGYANIPLTEDSKCMGRVVDKYNY